MYGYSGGFIDNNVIKDTNNYLNLTQYDEFDQRCTYDNCKRYEITSAEKDSSMKCTECWEEIDIDPDTDKEHQKLGIIDKDAYELWDGKMSFKIEEIVGRNDDK